MACFERRIIKNTPKANINKIYLLDHDPIKAWHKNNVLLIGDAAHAPIPTSGQGACQAIEDAWHISQCLLKNSNNHNAAFHEFTELRRTKTANITLGGRHLANSIFNQYINFCEQRNIASKNTNYQQRVERMAKGWSSGLTL